MHKALPFPFSWIGLNWQKAQGRFGPSVSG
jgi:hypothetical protein